MSKVKLSFSILLMFLLVGMFSSAAFATGKNTSMKDNLVTSDSALDNGLNNANQSGLNVGGQTNTFGDVIKSDDMSKGNVNGAHGTQRTHGDYQNNTNSCASCHQTHTGASDNLLFKNGEYATCTACHDGTLGFYNVFSGSDSAGTFGGTHDGNMSVHLANGTVKINAAPGGKAGDNGEVWGAEFSCASCHAPHGAFSDRLLHPNPNHMGNTVISEGGKKLLDIPVVDNAATTKIASGDVVYNDLAGTPVEANYVLSRFTIGATVDSVYAAKGLTTGDKVIQLMKWSTDKYVADNDPWLHGYDWDAGHTTKFYWSNLKNSADKEVLHTDRLKEGVILGNGFLATKASNAKTFKVGTTTKTTVLWFDDVTKGNIARSYIVKLDKNPADVNNVFTTNVFNLWTSKLANGTDNPNYVAIKGNGVKMSGFCASCHTDYLASSADETGTGLHSTAFRHSTASDSYTCVRCHYAHGTDVTIMRDAQGKNIGEITADTSYFPGETGAARDAIVKDYLMDKNPSSALKRYTNMAVCWGCHTSSHSEGTRNTDTYEYDSGTGATKDHNGLSTTGGVFGY